MARIINSYRVEKLICEDQLIQLREEDMSACFNVLDNQHVRLTNNGVIDFNPNGYLGLNGLKQGEFVIIRTAFTLNMPPNIAGIVSTNSWAAQRGLDICGSSIQVDNGFSGTVVLEITNRSNEPFELVFGKHIAKLVLETCDNSYDGNIPMRFHEMFIDPPKAEEEPDSVTYLMRFHEKVKAEVKDLVRARLKKLGLYNDDKP